MNADLRGSEGRRNKRITVLNLTVDLLIVLNPRKSAVMCG
jgi:hypothetical protein